MNWTDLIGVLVTIASTGSTTFLIPAGKAKLEEMRARAKAAAHDLAMKYAREAVRWAENEARRLKLHGDDVEQIALQHLEAACKGVKALKLWGKADLVGVLRSAYEEWRLEKKRFEAEVAAIAKESDEALARLHRAVKSAEELNATRLPGAEG